MKKVAITMLLVLAILLVGALPALADAGGVPNENACHGQIVSEGAHIFGGFAKAAASLGLSVQDTQQLLKDLCNGGLG